MSNTDWARLVESGATAGCAMGGLEEDGTASVTFVHDDRLGRGWSACLGNCTDGVIFIYHYE